MSKYALPGKTAVIFATFTLTTAVAFAESKIVISLAGEAFDGPPAFEISLAGKVIGSGTLKNAIETETQGRLFSNARPQSFLEEFTFTVPDAAFAADGEISIALTNDKYDDIEKGHDRNLFIDFISVNGLEVTSADLELVNAGEPFDLDFQAGLMPIYESNQRAVASPPAAGWPDPATAAAEDVSVLPAIAAGRMLVPVAPHAQVALGN
jgi:hypothetical protein